MENKYIVIIVIAAVLILAIGGFFSFKAIKNMVLIKGLAQENNLPSSAGQTQSEYANSYELSTCLVNAASGKNPEIDECTQTKLKALGFSDGINCVGYATRNKGSPVPTICNQDTIRYLSEVKSISECCNK